MITWLARAAGRPVWLGLWFAIAAVPGAFSTLLAQTKTPRQQIEDLVANLDSATKIHAEAYLSGADSGARYQAIRSLESAVGSQAVSRILVIAASSDPSPNVRTAAISILGQRRERRDEIVTLMQRIVATDTVAAVRAAALSLYPGSRTASGVSKGFDYLTRIIKRDTTAEVRAVAVQAIGREAKTATDGRELLGIYRTLSKDPSPKVREQVVRSMANPAFPRSINKDEVTLKLYLDLGTNDPSPEVRAAAVQGLIQSDLPPSRARAFAASRVRVEPDSAVLIAAIRTLRAYPGSSYDTLSTNRLLTRRIRDAGFLRAPTWLAIEQQRVIDLEAPNTIPWFMRIPVSMDAVPSTATKVRLVAFGDWADRNNENQRAVSGAIRQEHGKSAFDFGLTLGDNFYGIGIESPRSPRWEIEFEQQYGVMGIPIFGTLGNHDYYMDESPAAEIAYTGYSKSWRMPATHYSIKAGPAELFVIDTEQLESAWQLAWLDSALATSNAPWKIVAGHYDIYSNRSDGEDQSFKFLVALFKRHKVAAYINGHYHSLQHHQVDGIDYLTSGGGGRSLYSLNEADSTRYRDRKKFATKTHGFATIEITPTALLVKFIGVHGEELYSYERKRQD